MFSAGTNPQLDVLVMRQLIELIERAGRPPYLSSVVRLRLTYLLLQLKADERDIQAKLTAARNAVRDVASLRDVSKNETELTGQYISMIPYATEDHHKAA